MNEMRDEQDFELPFSGKSFYFYIETHQNLKSHNPIILKTW